MKKNEVEYGALEEYNPFTEKDQLKQPAMISVSNNVDSSEAGKAVSNFGDKKFQGDNEDKDSRESSKLIDGPVSNWPPFPAFCPIKPCLRLDFDTDFPEQYKGVIKFAYYLWTAYMLVMLCNILGSLCYYIIDNSMVSASTFGTAIIFGILFPILSFLMWFWPLYKAIKLDSSTNYFLFFIVMCGQIMVTGIQMLGINWLGSCGFINGLVMIRVSPVTGCIMISIGIWFCVLFSLFLLLLFKINYLYRHSSVSDIKTAKSELTNDIIKGTVPFERK